MSGAAIQTGAPLKLLICAVEQSGDALGAALIKSLKAKNSSLEFFGCGGPLMAETGLQSLFPIERFSVIGPVGALKALPLALRSADILADVAEKERVDASILIDGWSFARIAAKKIKKQQPAARIYKYVAPQVWASRPHRAKTVAALFDGVLTLFEFEPAWFEKEGAKARFVGHSGFQEAAKSAYDNEEFRNRYNLTSEKILAVLPGSRKSEVRRLLPLFRRTVEIVRSHTPLFRTIIPAAPSVVDQVEEAARDWPGGATVIPVDERYKAYNAADAALVASGTATTELAISKTPMVVGYQVDWASAMWIRSVVTVTHLSMINIAAGREIIPEFLQEGCKPEAMAAALAPLLNDSAERRAQLEAFPAQLEKFGIGGPPAADLAAETLLDWIARDS